MKKAERNRKRNKKVNDELFIVQSNNIVQINIKTIKGAFEQLEQKEHDLYHVFQTLIERILIHKDGTVDIIYTFENPL
ncbi:hypothetical protein AAHB51_05610 [Bacillus cereus]